MTLTRRHFAWSVARSIAMTVVCFVAASLAAGAQTPAARFVDSARVEIDRAVHDMDMARLDQAGVLLDRALVAFPDDPYLLHYRGYLAYRRVTGMMMSGASDSVGPIIARGLADLAKSAERLAWPETVQLEACLNAFRIPLEPGSGMTLGPLTGRLSGQASKMGPDNPRVALLQAYLAERTPESMGGGTDKAKQRASTALTLFARDQPAPLAPDWGKDEAEALLARLSKSSEQRNP